MSITSVILDMLAAIRSAATICAPFGPRPYSCMTSPRSIHSRMSTSASYGSESAPGSRFTTMASTPTSSSQRLYAPTRVLFPLPAVPTKKMYLIASPPMSWDTHGGNHIKSFTPLPPS